MLKSLPIEGNKLRQTTAIAKKSLPRLVHHFHQPITKEIARHKIKREKLIKDNKNFSPSIFSKWEICMLK
jgi:hypothetical protein